MSFKINVTFVKFQFVFLYYSLFKLIFLRTEKYSYSNDHIDLTDKLISNLHFPFKNLFYLFLFQVSLYKVRNLLMSSRKCSNSPELHYTRDFLGVNSQLNYCS